MNLEEQFKEFLSTLDHRPLSAIAIAVYKILFCIAIKTEWVEWFSVANITLMSKCNISLKQLQNARNELKTKNYIDYKKGRNQNEAPKYSIARLYKDDGIKKGQAEGMTEGTTEVTPEGTTEGNIITKLNLLFNYIINNKLTDFKNVKQEDANAIMATIKRLGLEADNTTVKYIKGQALIDLKIQYWVIKELHYSPFKVYINKLSHDIFVHTYLKSKKYITMKDDYRLEEIINYFYKCLTNEVEGCK